MCIRDRYEPFRAYAQEAGYKVQSIVDPDTAVPVGVGTIDGKFGADVYKRQLGSNPGPYFLPGRRKDHGTHRAARPVGTPAGRDRAARCV